MSGSNQRHIKPGALTNMVEGGNKVRDQHGVRSPDGQQYQRTRQRQKSPPSELIDTLALTEPKATANSHQGSRYSTQTRRHVIKEGLVYKRRKMGVKHEVKAWMVVGKSGRLRLVAEGKAKKTGMQVATPLGSADNVEKGEEIGTTVTGKRVGKETKAGKDHFMNHQVAVLTEAIGPQKVGGSSVEEASH